MVGGTDLGDDLVAILERLWDGAYSRNPYKTLMGPDPSRSAGGPLHARIRSRPRGPAYGVALLVVGRELTRPSATRGCRAALHFMADGLSGFLVPGGFLAAVGPCGLVEGGERHGLVVPSGSCVPIGASMVVGAPGSPQLPPDPRWSESSPPPQP
ncbi:hypothetical protein GCM10010244_82440 [Streptomyces coeruleorubidus]|nr:hypothetical protein GCM10010244_82440 [Streptomyces bellus]